MNPLILAVALTQLEPSPPPPGLPSGEEIVQRIVLPEPDRAPVSTHCEICLLIYVHSPVSPGVEMIREECGFNPLTVPDMRTRQEEIAVHGTFSYLSWEDWGTWYGPHRIHSVVPVLLPPCY